MHARTHGVCLFADCIVRRYRFYVMLLRLLLFVSCLVVVGCGSSAHTHAISESRTRTPESGGLLLQTLTLLLPLTSRGIHPEARP